MSGIPSSLVKRWTISALNNEHFGVADTTLKLEAKLLLNSGNK